MIQTLLCISFLGLGQITGKIKVTILGLRNNSGQVGIRFFDQPDGFPSVRNKANKEVFVNPINGEAKFEFHSIPYGVYAIGSIHDENRNNEIDKNFIGIPEEGFGATNNPTILLGPPSFKSASFRLDKSEIEVKIKMIYY